MNNAPISTGLSQPSASKAADVWAMGAFAAAIVVPWWAVVTSPASPTFYKEWLAVVAMAFAGLLLPPGIALRDFLSRHPMVLAAGAIVAVLAVQGLALPGIWPKATLLAAGVLFFVLCVAIGRAIRLRLGEGGFALLASCLLIAASGSCVFASIQLVGLDQAIPFIAKRTDNRLFGNVGQANHFADLLWLGIAAATYFGARRRLPVAGAVAIVVVLQIFSVFSGSRTVWLYAVLFVLLGVAVVVGGGVAAPRLLARAFLLAGVCYAVVALAVGSSSVLEKFNVVSAEQRVGNVNGDESIQQRLWFWRTGLETAWRYPLLGAGAGQLAGHARERALTYADAPSRSADSQAHNVFIQLAAELGIPLAAAVAFAFIVWIGRAWRVARRSNEALACMAMTGVILVHANLEHPLGYLYFIAVFGALVGSVPSPEDSCSRPHLPIAPDALRFASFAVLALAGLAYVQFGQADRAARLVVAQVRGGLPPQPTVELAERLDALPRWSPYVDYAETLSLMIAIPTERTAVELADRCERAVMFGPTPYLLARCATVLQTAGRPERAKNFAESLCKTYSDSAPVLAQSMEFISQYSPEAADVASSCVQRTSQ